VQSEISETPVSPQSAFSQDKEGLVFIESDTENPLKASSSTPRFVELHELSFI